MSELNPVIDVIERGHICTYPKDAEGRRIGQDRCADCGTLWPCQTILAARKASGQRFKQLSNGRWT